MVHIDGGKTLMIKIKQINFYKEKKKSVAQHWWPTDGDLVSTLTAKREEEHLDSPAIFQLPGIDVA